MVTTRCGFHKMYEDLQQAARRSDGSEGLINGDVMSLLAVRHMRRRSDCTTSSSRSQHSKSGGRIYILSHPRTHKGSGDRPLRCIRVSRRETSPSPEPRGPFRRGGKVLVCQQERSYHVVCGLRSGRAGGGTRGTGSRAGAHGGRGGGSCSCSK